MSDRRKGNGTLCEEKAGKSGAGEEAAVRSPEAGVKILGSGCAKCRRLEANTREALKQLGVDAAVEHVTDFAEIAAYGVLTTPALVVDGKAVSCGVVLSVPEAVSALKKCGYQNER